jgi:hypothetical protein
MGPMYTYLAPAAVQLHIDMSAAIMPFEVPALWFEFFRPGPERHSSISSPPSISAIIH